MSRALRRAAERESVQFVRALPAELVPVPGEEWPPYPAGSSTAPREVWRSRSFVVQVYLAPAASGVIERISVRRTDGADGITWDQLQGIKREIGRGHVAAVELYPPDESIVAVANMRHLWTLPVGAEPAWMWRPVGVR